MHYHRNLILIHHYRIAGMYTANTMATAIEALGMALPYSSSTPADDPMKIAECKMSGDCWY